MREILFRAKRIDNGEWVEGWLLKDEVTGQYFIHASGNSVNESDKVKEEGCLRFVAFEIDETNICQCTGLTDKNGNKIWENDIVSFKHEKFDFDDGLEPWKITCLPNKKEYKRNYVVEFCNTPTHYGLRFRNKSIWFMIHRMTVAMHDVEVIGNTFDNADLLKGQFKPHKTVEYDY